MTTPPSSMPSAAVAATPSDFPVDVRGGKPNTTAKEVLPMAEWIAKEWKTELLESLPSRQTFAPNQSFVEEYVAANRSLPSSSLLLLRHHPLKTLEDRHSSATPSNRSPVGASKNCCFDLQRSIATALSGLVTGKCHQGAIDSIAVKTRHISTLQQSPVPATGASHAPLLLGKREGRLHPAGAHREALPCQGGEPPSCRIIGENCKRLGEERSLHCRIVVGPS